MAKTVGRETRQKLVQTRYRMVIAAAEIILQDINWREGATIPELAMAMTEELNFRIDQIFLFRSLRSNPNTFKLRESGQTYHVELKPATPLKKKR